MNDQSFKLTKQQELLIVVNEIFDLSALVLLLVFVYRSYLSAVPKPGIYYIFLTVGFAGLFLFRYFKAVVQGKKDGMSIPESFVRFELDRRDRAQANLKDVTYFPKKGRKVYVWILFGGLVVLPILIMLLLPFVNDIPDFQSILIVEIGFGIFPAIIGYVTYKRWTEAREKKISLLDRYLEWFQELEVNRLQKTDANLLNERNLLIQMVALIICGMVLIITTQFDSGNANAFVFDLFGSCFVLFGACAIFDILVYHSIFKSRSKPGSAGIAK